MVIPSAAVSREESAVLARKQIPHRSIRNDNPENKSNGPPKFAGYFACKSLDS
jgi:hypothetical protein